MAVNLGHLIQNIRTESIPIIPAVKVIPGVILTDLIPEISNKKHEFTKTMEKFVKKVEVMEPRK